LVSSQDYPLRSFIESAVKKELRQLEDAFRQTQAQLRVFEARYELSTDEFVSSYEANQIDETLETIEWLGEYRMAQHIQRKIDGVKGIEFAH